jgi:CO dehydrogenase maturation factor
MKIAVSGKGGAGKTTVAGVMARILGDRGKKVIAIDADPDSNLASAIGMDEESTKGVKPLPPWKSSSPNGRARKRASMAPSSS